MKVSREKGRCISQKGSREKQQANDRGVTPLGSRWEEPQQKAPLRNETPKSQTANSLQVQLQALMPCNYHLISSLYQPQEGNPIIMPISLMRKVKFSHQFKALQRRAECNVKNLTLNKRQLLRE